MIFTKNNHKSYKEILPGIELKPLIHGSSTLLGEFRLNKGSRVPSHSHPHEQIGYLISGKMRFFAGGETFDAEPGDSWCFKGDQEHSAEVMEDSLVVEVFSPIREEYLF
ncbi:MAG: cupin domain-containing protein [Syntrophales bacterium]|nr:cupin domain-containing protein [Syntrophales bacterium]